MRLWGKTVEESVLTESTKVTEKLGKAGEKRVHAKGAKFFARPQRSLVVPCGSFLFRKISPIVRKYSGILKNKEINYKAKIAEYLSEKYK